MAKGFEFYGYEESERFSSIRSLIDDEILSNRNTDEKQSEDISAETSAREEEDVKINEKVNALGEKDAELEAKDAELESAIADESSRALSAETALDTKIADEYNRAVAAEIEIQNQIDVINGDGDGSIKKAVAEGVAEVVANAPEDFDTLQEVADYIASDKTKAAEIEISLSEHSAELVEHESRLETLEGDVEEISSALTAEVSRATAKENELEASVAAKADQSDLESTNSELQALKTVVESLSGDTGEIVSALNESIAAVDAKAEANASSISELGNKESALESAFSNFVSGTYADDKASIEGSLSALTEELGIEVANINEALSGKATVEQVTELGEELQGNIDDLESSVSGLLDTKLDIMEFDSYKDEADAKFLEESDLAPYALTSAVTDMVADAVAPLAIKEEVDEVDNSLLARIQNIERYISGDENALTEINNTVAEELLADPSTTKVVISNGKVSNVNVPDTNKIKTLTADFEDGAVITLEGTKSIMLAQRTSGASVENLTVIAPASETSTTVTLSANCTNVNITNASLTVGNGYTVQNVNLITDGESETSNITVNAEFISPATVNTETSNNLTITSKNAPEDNVDLTINAPNATVTINSSWDEVESNVGADTLYVGPKAHINTLTVTKGNVIVNDVLVSNRIDNVVNTTPYTVDVARFDATDATSFSRNVMKNGITTVKNDITCLTNIGYGILANGNYELRLGGYNVEVGGNNYGFYTRGTMVFDVYGDNGTMVNNKSYLFWADGSSVINIHGGTYIGTTHCLYLYSKTATINVYDGDFKLTGADKKFLVNYYDKVWDPNNKRVHIYGGRFYGFDPSNSMGEPSGPVNLLDSGYHVVHTVVDGEDVYEVVQD